MATLEIPEELLVKLRAIAERDKCSVEDVLTRLVESYGETSELPRTRSLLEFEGLGAHLWNGVDAQEYVNELRSEWDDPFASIAGIFDADITDMSETIIVAKSRDDASE